METMETQLPFQSQQPIFSKIGGLSELLNMSEEDRKKYYRSLDDYWTDICVMESAVEEGFEKGMEKGLKKGMEKGLKKGMEKGMAMGIEKGKAMVEKNKKETAIKMKQCGFSMEQIVLISGLSEEEIEKL